MNSPILKTQVANRRTSWLELFYDLVYVIVIAKATSILTKTNNFVTFYDYTIFILTFLPIWWSWTGHTLYANRFFEDDKYNWLITFIQMFFVIILGLIIDQMFTKYTVIFSISYFLIRLLIVISYWRIHQNSKATKPVTSLLLKGFGTGSVLWFLSIFAPKPYVFFIWALAFLIEFFTPWYGQKTLSKVSVHKEHLPERFGLLAIILIGEIVSNIVSAAHNLEINLFTITSLIYGFCIICLIWWFYFEVLEKSLKGKS